jgi:hypothetical protein
MKHKLLQAIKLLAARKATLLCCFSFEETFSPGVQNNANSVLRLVSEYQTKVTLLKGVVITKSKKDILQGLLIFLQ